MEKGTYAYYIHWISLMENKNNDVAAWRRMGKC